MSTTSTTTTATSTSTSRNAAAATVVPNDPEELKSLVVRKIGELCTQEESSLLSSPFPVLCQMGQAMRTNPSGGQQKLLVAEIIDKGKANISYKVSLSTKAAATAAATTPSSPLAVYAKVCFSYARWSPSRPFDLARTENEFWIMRKMTKFFRGDDDDDNDTDEHEQENSSREQQQLDHNDKEAATAAVVQLAEPYHLVTLSDTAKLFVAEWSKVCMTSSNAYQES